MQNGTAIVENSLAIYLRSNIQLLYNSVKILLRHLPKGNEGISPERPMDGRS